MPRLLFKFLGLSFLLLCCTAFGFFKANTLKSRLDALEKIKNGLLTLKERLRLHSGDKNRLISGCFPNIDKLLQSLPPEDKKLWNEFFAHFGCSDTKSEYERCASFITLFDNKINTLSREIGEQQKLYKSLGFFSGVFLCIFFI
ncbi:MAG: stage III sporulation protein AB [Clostridia bacterium]|nr:stage III sporulation protein AB [Clostridia bacterium]